MAKKVAMESTLSLVLLAMMAALCQAQLPPLPPLPTGLTLPPNFTLPTLPPEEDLPLIVLNVPGYATVKGGPSLSWFTGRPYTYFRGLPYAKAPTNETRFLVSLRSFVPSFHHNGHVFFCDFVWVAARTHWAT